MKKKVGLLVAASMLFGGIVSAAGLYGTFEGYQIVRVQSGGKTITAGDVPAVNLNGRTMVPIYMLRDLGANISWDAKTETVDVTLGESAVQQSNDIVSIANTMKPLGFSYVEMVSNGGEFIQISFYYNGLLDNMPVDTYNQLLLKSANSAAESTRIVDSNNTEFTVLTDYVRDFYAGKITESVLQSHYKFNGQPASQQTQPAPITGGTTSSIIKSKIVGDFEGFNEGNIYELDNGQIWKQISYKYKYKYKYRPEVLIYKEGSRYYMTVEDVDGEIEVQLLN